MFWTLGGKQVGKAALSGWQLLSAAPAGSRLWPFHGDLDSLLDGDQRSVVVTETYPREFYRHIKPSTASPGPWSKRRQSDRKEWIPSVLGWARALGVEWAADVLHRVETGFSANANGEDEFDAVVGLLGMIAVVTGKLPSGEPADDPIVTEIEGWMLGRQNSQEPAPKGGQTVIDGFLTDTGPRAPGTKTWVVHLFKAWLEREGWSILTVLGWEDVRAERDGQYLIAEAKGLTKDVGTDLDTLYGQLLRRMTDDLDRRSETKFAVVVPIGAVDKALRVHSGVRRRLGIVIYSVDDQGDVTAHT